MASAVIKLELKHASIVYKRQGDFSLLLNANRIGYLNTSYIKQFCVDPKNLTVWLEIEDSVISISYKRYEKEDCFEWLVRDLEALQI